MIKYLTFLLSIVSVILSVIILTKVDRNKEKYCVDISGGFKGCDCAKSGACTKGLI